MTKEDIEAARKRIKTGLLLGLPDDAHQQVLGDVDALCEAARQPKLPNEPSKGWNLDFELKYNTGQGYYKRVTRLMDALLSGDWGRMVAQDVREWIESKSARQPESLVGMKVRTNNGEKWTVADQRPEEFILEMRTVGGVLLDERIAHRDDFELLEDADA